jgi:hypothetical protein
MRRLATLLVLAVLGLSAGDALAAGRGGAPKGRRPAAAKRMATKLAQRAKGPNKERPRNSTKRTQRGLQRAMSRRDVGLGGREAKRAREQVARGFGDGDTRPRHTLKWRRH